MSFHYHRQNVPLVIAAAVVTTALLCIALFRPHPTAPRMPEPAVAQQKLQQFNLTGFDEKGKKFWSLKGDAAQIEPGENVYLEQNVTLRMRDDTIITTDRVQWSQNGGRLQTDSPVYVDHANAKIRGQGAVGEPAKNYVQLNRNILMNIHPDTVVTCDGPLKIYYDQHRMELYRNVRVKDGRGRLIAKRMDVYFDPEQKKVDRIVATGDVQIERGTDTTRAKKAIYNPTTGSVRLEGNPEITIHQGASSLVAPAAAK